MSDWSGPLIAVDWGTSNRRAYLVDACGRVIDQMEDGEGVTSVSGGEFPAAVRQIEERLGAHPMLLAGMIGSNRGWIEAPYVPCPAGVAEVAKRLVPAEGDAKAIVPGLSSIEEGRGDVMRGEEVQIFGLGAEQGGGEGLTICHPGTHTKWATTSAAQVERFRTIMTGEMFALLRKHSILAPMLGADVEPGEAFFAGVDAGFSGVGLTAELFSLRAGVLLSLRPQEEVAPYASGLLIGADAREGLRWSRAEREVVVLGAPTLTRLYAAALRHVGQQAREVDGAEAFIAGMQAIRSSLK
jgi:2-dehydro-3-deoxygalactonokinase